MEIKRKDTGEILLQVTGNSLELADLRGVNLQGADLFGQDLYFADLTGANLADANLSNANLTGSQLLRSSLVGADLDGCNLTNTNLTDADLRGANLTNAQLTSTLLSGANVIGARLCMTIFVYCTDLHKAVGLDRIKHLAPSSLDRYTLVENVQRLPDTFLVGVGYAPEEIVDYRRLYGPPLPYYSCFISYRRIPSNIDFVVNHLYPDLKANGVRCWIDIANMQGGMYYPTQLSLAIKEYEKVILVCSQSALLRQNVVDEIIAAMDREQEMGTTKLFPVTLDKFIVSDKILTVADKKMQTQQWSVDWVRRVRKYHILDFRGWKNHQTYSEALERLLHDLRKTPAR